MKKLALTLNLVLTLTAATAQNSWTNRYNGPANDSDIANAITCDGSSNVIVTGSSVGAGSASDYATIKYSGTGVPLWTNRYNGPGNGVDEARAIWVDSNGDLFVTGRSAGSGSGADYATIKYSSAGVPSWTNRYNGPGNSTDWSQAIAVDGSGSPFVTGYSFSTASAGSDDYATIKYSSAGVPLWTNRYNGSGDGIDRANAIAIDGIGNVFVAGHSDGNGSGADFVTLKYSNSGAALWTNRYNGPWDGNDIARAIKVDSIGNVFVTGESVGVEGNYDYVTIKYSNSGVPLWTNRYNGPGNGGDVANAIAVDGSGNVLVTGYSTGSGSSSDFTTLKYSNSGTPLWTNRYDGPVSGIDQALAVAVDGRGSVFVTGVSAGTGSGDDYVTIKYSNAGMGLSTNRYNGPGNSADWSQAVVVDSIGNTFIAGRSRGTGGIDDYATIKYEPVETCPLIIVHPTTLPSPTNGFSYSLNLIASGGNAPNLFTVSAGDLPPGLTLNTNGLLSGTVATPLIASTFIIMATDANGCTGARFYSPNIVQKSWTNLFSASVASAIVIDYLGNVIVAGPSDPSGLGDADYATIKYSNAGVPLWTNRHGGPEQQNDWARAIAVDGSNNVFVTGMSWNGDTRWEDYATIKYSSAGVPLWTNFFTRGAFRSDEAYAIAVDTNGSVFVTGFSEGGFATSSDYATIKYSNDGVPIWTNYYDGSDHQFDTAYAIAVDGGGNVFVTGEAIETPTSFDFTTIKYSNDGIPLWTNRFNGSTNVFENDDRDPTLVLDAEGNVFVSGNSFRGYSNIVDFVVIKYSNNGISLWTNRIPYFIGSGNSFLGVPKPMVTDYNGNVFVTGASSNDCVTIKLSSAGVPLWTNRFNGPANGSDSGHAIAADENGNVFVAGFASGAGHLMIKYSNDGEPLWTNYNNSGSRAIAVDAGGSAFVTGGATIKYVSAGILQMSLLENPAASAVEFSFDLVAEIGGQFAIQSSTNLVDWNVIRQVTIPVGGRTNIVEALVPGTGRTFYRALRL